MLSSFPAALSIESDVCNYLSVPVTNKPPPVNWRRFVCLELLSTLQVLICKINVNLNWTWHDVTSWDNYCKHQLPRHALQGYVLAQQSLRIMTLTHLLIMCQQLTFITVFVLHVDCTWDFWPWCKSNYWKSLMTQQQQGRKGGLGHPKHPKTSLNNCVVIDLHSHFTSACWWLTENQFHFKSKGSLNNPQRDLRSDLHVYAAAYNILITFSRSECLWNRCIAFPVILLFTHEFNKYNMDRSDRIAHTLPINKLLYKHLLSDWNLKVLMFRLFRELLISGCLLIFGISHRGKSNWSDFFDL